MSSHIKIRKGNSTLIRKTKLHADARTTARRQQQVDELYDGIIEWYEDTTCEELDEVTHGESLKNLIEGVIE